MAQAYCQVCQGTDLTFENGVLVCGGCGAHQNVFEEEAEFRAGIDDTRGKRKAANSSVVQHTQATQLAQVEQQAAQKLQTAALAYVCCLQQLLQAQADCLTTRFGVSSQVTSVLRQLWLTHLPSTGMLESAPRRSAATAAGLQDLDAAETDCEDAAQAPGAAAGPDSAETQLISALVEPTKMRSLFWGLLHPQVTLQLCFLACCLLREAVTCYDIITWALDADLPFLGLPDIAKTCLSEQELDALDVRCLEASVWVSPMGLFSRTCHLADHLNVELPHVAGEALILREVQELGLPQVVADVSLQLCFLYLIRTPRMALAAIGKSSQPTPYVWLSGALLVAVKLIYGLGGAVRAVPFIPQAPGPPGGWQAWAQAVMQRLPGLSNMLLSEHEVLALDPDMQQQYLQFCRHHMFTGHPTVKDMGDVQKLLTGWYSAAAAQSPTAHTTAAASTAAETGQAPHHGRQNQPSPREAGPGSAAGTAGNTSAAMYSLTAPGASSAGTSSTSSNYRMGYRLDPQLAAVVLVLAAYSRCTPAVLLECARALEKQMVSVEAGVKILKEIKHTT